MASQPQTGAPHYAFIGGGNMANSIIGGLLKNGCAAEAITVADVMAEQRERLAAQYQVQVTDSNQTAAENADVIILAVKPHQMESVCADITPVLQPQKLLLSIAAGVRCDSIRHWTGQISPIVRCMPNTPALVGAGASALYASADCSAAQRASASSILSAAGVVCWVETEAQLDAVTALSGSGPAYFFRLIECMTQAASDMGLPAETAETLAIETAYGAACMARARQDSPAQLRENVTSKGGTTAAALASFETDQLPDIVKRAMEAARIRAEELGKPADNSTSNTGRP